MRIRFPDDCGRCEHHYCYDMNIDDYVDGCRLLRIEQDGDSIEDCPLISKETENDYKEYLDNHYLHNLIGSLEDAIDMPKPLSFREWEKQKAIDTSMSY